MEIKEINIQEIIPYEKNPRKNQKAVPFVARSIERFGFKVPIVIDKNKVIVAGHTRYLAAQKLGYRSVPCIIADDLTDKQVKAFRLADNKVAEKAEWDFDLLNEELLDLDAYEMFELGFDDILKDEAEPVEDEYDPDIEEAKQTDIKPGQIFKLGNHRLMCGDSTSKKDVDKLLNGEVMDLVVTDPPYNVDISNSKGMKIENDSMSNEKFIDFLTSAFDNLASALKPGGAFYIWFASRTHVQFEQALNNNNLVVRQELIWNKNSLVLSRQDYQWKHEPCLYGWKDGAAHFFTDDRTQTTVIEDAKPDFKKLKKEDLVKMLEDIYSDRISATIINENRPSSNDLHPTMKPIKLIARLIKNSSKEKERVLDLFGGSGSTLIACEQLNRACFIMEYDPAYAQVIIDRWEQFTGGKAECLKK